MPVEDVSMLSEPGLNTWTSYDKSIIEVSAVAEGVYTPLGKEAMELLVNGGWVERERGGGGRRAGGR